MGIDAGDALMVHAALRKVGPVIGGPDAIIAALSDALGPEGTLLAYADWQGQEAIDAGTERTDILAFDPLRARAARDNGAFPELLRTTPGALRSRNPGASVVALGGRSRWFTENHPLDYGYGPGTPLSRLVEAGGKVLMLGAPLDTMTLLHHAEHLAATSKRIIRFDIPLLEGGSTVWRQAEEFDTSDPPGDLPEDYMASVVEAFLATGRGTRGSIAAAPSVLVNAADIVGFAIDWLERRSTPA
jgi:aminoglycoside 3-N-acetyltransferase